LQENRPTKGGTLAHLQNQVDPFSEGSNDPPSPQAKKQRLNAPGGQASRRSRFFHGDAAGNGVSESLAHRLPKPVSSSPYGGVGVPVPTEEDRETGLWSPERSASPQLPSQGIAKRLQLSQIPISHRSKPAGDASPRHHSPTGEADDAGTFPSKKFQPKPIESPSLLIDNLYEANSCIPQQPLTPAGGQTCTAPLSETFCSGPLQGAGSSQQFGAAGRICDSGSQSAGGSSGGAKDADCEDCDFKDEYASVFDFL
jgi:hypothetical protein